MIPRRIVPSIFLLAFLSCHGPSRPEPPETPNVILIMTDNHGAWTLGCYGNQDIRTPNIDRLAKEGILFSRAYSSNAVCSPTRATFLTGLMPSQHGVHTWLRSGHLQIGPDARSTIEEFHTLPEILAESGYVCGLSGKWHLGKNMEPQEGFTFWVTKPHGGTAEFYDQPVIENGEIRKEPTYLTDFWTDRAITFIEQNQKRPFFLFLAYNGPYGLSRYQLRAGRNRHVATYAEKELPSFPREKMHPWLFNNKEYLNNVKAMRRYGVELSGVDDGVGRVMDSIKHLGLDGKTLVIFTADQGWAGGQQGIWGMGDHTRPLHAFDSTMHIPLIYRLPGSIPAGRRSPFMVSNYDLLPTVLDYVGLREKTPTEPRRPGRSHAAILRGGTLDPPKAVFYEFENTRAIRTDGWKYIHRFPDGPDELYDLRNDPGERQNLIAATAHSGTGTDLHRRLEAFFDRYADPRYDLKKGGGSKTHLLYRR